MFSFLGIHQNFKVIAGLNYRFRGNLHVHVFSTYKTGIMTTLNDVIMCCAGTGRFRKKVCLAFSLVHISFLGILFIWPMLNSNFSIKFSSLLNILISSRSVNIHVIKIITRNLADVWHIIEHVLTWRVHCSS